ncbi:P-type conjugative transfer protein TrbJ [Dickeya dianthicola]|uniref:P-type conjugative transfer protein TrbJ n=1 Tax=Dickeya dianthicola TaxID=204039 RepID=UPI0018678F37|nr:P-type conjugative transfer protein TrbJ [Dickeya dianthicola]QOL14237.1 P-type conjugative transfer protein TrbJ [Dickeya dianthicola]
MKTVWLVILLALLPLRPAQALTVFDPANYAQNTLSAARALDQINNQVIQLQNEAQMLIYQARNLTRLPFTVTDQLRTTLAGTDRLIAQARGLAYEVQRMDSDFARLYPEQYAITVGHDRLYQDTRARWVNTLAGLHTALQMQAQMVQSLSADEGTLSALVGQSQAATGALQAMQATNQLLALQAKQTMQGQQLQLTQDRAVALELARQAAAVERGREITRRFLGTGTPYTPQPVNFYGKDGGE